MTDNASNPVADVPRQPRTIAVVAAELEAALIASTRLKALSDELHGLLGRRKRGPRKVAP